MRGRGTAGKVTVPQWIENNEIASGKGYQTEQRPSAMSFVQAGQIRAVNKGVSHEAAVTHRRIHQSLSRPLATQQLPWVALSAGAIVKVTQSESSRSCCEAAVTHTAQIDGDKREFLIRSEMRHPESCAEA